MSLSIEEIEEFENALRTVKEYETKTDMKIIRPKRYQQAMDIIAESKRQKESMELGERMERLENTVSKLVNVKVDDIKEPAEQTVETKTVEEK